MGSENCSRLRPSQADHMSPPAPTDPSPADLRKLVLNYLCHYCFVDSARSFAKETPWRDPTSEDDGDDRGFVTLDAEQLRRLEVRRDVREHILSGRISEARSLVKSQFPFVLDSSLGGDLVLASSPGSSQATAPEATHVLTYPNSLTPTNIALNIDIQNWIEMIRTIPLPYPPVDSSLPPALPPAPVEQNVSALILTAQQLYARAKALSPPDDKTFGEELVSIAGLMAYTEPEKSHESLRHHLDWTRREGIATQVNSAILSSLGFQPYPPLATLIRQLTFVFVMLHEFGVPPPKDGYPSGVEVLEPDEGEMDWGLETKAIPEFKLDRYLSKEERKGRQRRTEEEDDDMDMEDGQGEDEEIEAEGEGEGDEDEDEDEDEEEEMEEDT